jgi:hypothetical protein
MWRYSTISGTVTDDAGDAVPYVRVPALRRTVVAGRWQMVNSNIGANADDNGAYRITGLVPGDYALVITSMVSSLPASLLSVADLMRRTPGPESSAKMAELSADGTGGFANDLMQGLRSALATCCCKECEGESTDGRSKPIRPSGIERRNALGSCVHGFDRVTPVRVSICTQR